MESQALTWQLSSSGSNIDINQAEAAWSILIWPWKFHCVIFPILNWLYWFQILQDSRVGESLVGGVSNNLPAYFKTTIGHSNIRTVSEVTYLYGVLYKNDSNIY